MGSAVRSADSEVTDLLGAGSGAELDLGAGPGRKLPRERALLSLRPDLGAGRPDDLPPPEVLFDFSAGGSIGNHWPTTVGKSFRRKQN